MFNQIVCGNHLEILPRFPDDTFDMFLTSPPTYTPDEYEQVKAAMAAAGIEKHTDFARSAVMKKTAEILTEKQDG